MPCLGFRTSPGWLSDFSLVKSWNLVLTGEYPLLHVRVHVPSLCVTPQIQMQPLDHLTGDSILRDVKFLYMPTASDCQVIE